MLQRKLIYASIVGWVVFCSSYSVRAQVNIQTGSAVFSIPMFNWQDDKSRLASNVALSYNSGNGLKVNDVASNVGQGWQLVAGGVITRMQVGEPDDQPAHLGAVSLRQPNQTEVDHDIAKYPAGWLHAPVPAANGCPEALTKYPIYGAKNELYAPFNVTAEDRQLDYFAFNFNGKAGLFVLDPENGGTGQSLGDSKMKITFQMDPNRLEPGIRTTITSFTIQDVDGLIYKFADYGYAQVLHSAFCDPAVTQALTQPTFGTGAIYNQAGFPDPGIDNPKVINSWYLTEVDDPLTLHQIVYHYTNRTVDNMAETGISYNQPKGYFIVSHKRSITSTPEIDYISYPDQHYVHFRYASSDRADLKGEQALSAVDITYNPTGGAGVRTLSEYQLNTTYFILNHYGTPSTDYEKSVARLCLRSVKKLGVDLKSDSPPYSFDYFLGSNGQEDFVPPPFFYAKDIWGYYNGQNSQDVDGNPVPLDVTVSQLSNVMLEGLCFFRRPTVHDAPVLNLLNPKLGFAKNGLLKQVVYPTGGTLSYQYDQNMGVLVSGGSSTMVGGVHVTSTSSTDGGYSNGCSNAIVTNYKYVGSDGTSSSLWGLEMPVNVINSRSHYNAEQLKKHLSLSCGACCYYNYAYPGILSQTEVVDLVGWQKFMESIQPYLTILTVITDVMDIATVAGGATGFGAIAAVIVDYIGAVAEIGFSCLSGDGNNDTNNQTFYNSDLNGASPLPTQFNRVEIVEGAGTMGKTVQEFTDSNYYAYWVGPGANIDFSAKQRFAPWAYGLPRFITQYDASGNKIKQIENAYTITSNQLYYGNFDEKRNAWSGPPVTNCKCTVNYTTSQNSTDYIDPSKYDLNYTSSSIGAPLGDPMVDPITVDMYGMFSGRAELNTSYERVYRVNDPTQYVETVTTYQYDDQNFQVNSTTITQSDGKQLTKSITYPDSYQPATTNPELNNLFHNNILNEPISISQSVGNMIDEKVTVYTTLANGGIRPGKILQQRFAKPTPASVYSPDDNTNNTKYKTIQTFTYDANSNLTGMQDEGGRSVANIYDYNDKYIVASVVNADPLVDAPAYTSFETSSLGGWVLTGSTAPGMGAMTGTQSFALSSGNGLAAPINTAKSYTVSLWATGAVSVNGGISPIKSAPVINGFTYYEYIIPAGSTTAVISGNATIDELRLYPQTARMKTTTYDPLIGKTSECDENNRITYYEYDNLGRLKFVKDENHYALKMYEYNNVSPAKQNGCPGTYSNGLVAEVFTRSNCGAGYQGGAATYTVPAGRYSSSLSQADADAQVETDVLTNGQGYADGAGSCQLIYYNDAFSAQETTQTCAPGSKGNAVTYSVPANKYSSIVDKATANKLALDEISANAQAYANSPAGMSCSFDSDPDWEYTVGDPTSCQTVSGVGHIFYYATDLNPNSSTYQQWQYIDGGPSSSCPAQTIYARISIDGGYTDTYGQARGNVVVHFYSDNACTQDLSVTNLVVNYTVTWDYDGTTGGGSLPPASGTSVAIAPDAVLDKQEDPNCDPTIGICLRSPYTYALTAGNYIIKF
jgi:hypothetical protein